MKKKKGFTLLELVMVCAIISIMLSFPIIIIKNYINAKDTINGISIQKEIVSAIDRWSSENINAKEKPSNFNSLNSQFKRVYEYIENDNVLSYLGAKYVQDYNGNGNIKNVFDNINISPMMICDNKIAKFEDGILIINFDKKLRDEVDSNIGIIIRDDVNKGQGVYSVYPLDNSGKKIYNLEKLKQNHYIVL